MSVCKSDASDYWVPVLLGYKGLFLIVGLWLAATTYRVKIKELRDSKLIVACVISISLVSMVLTLITFLLPTSPNERYGVIGSFILILLTSVLFLLFVTRVSFVTYGFSYTNSRVYKEEGEYLTLYKHCWESNITLEVWHVRK